MAQIYVPDSLPDDSEPLSQRYNDYAFEATQLSQPVYSQTQNTQGTAFANSQVEPRKKYWATFIPTNPAHSILKIPWTKSQLQIGRGPVGHSHNDVVLAEKRVSNRHCRITLGIQEEGSSDLSRYTMQAWKDGESEPDVWIEDLKSSNGTYVNGARITHRVLLRHGDEISLGHAATLDNHDVRYIFRSVGSKGTKMGQTASKGGLDVVGQVYERYQLLETLGSGTFADVRKAVDVETGNMRAVKQIVKHRFAADKNTLALFQREIAICSALQHENICRLIEYFEDPQHICLILEYIDGGDLLDYIQGYPNSSGGGLPEDHAAKLSLQICRAMAYTKHEMGVTHRDLKPENILVTRETPDSPQTIKIADFGLAKMVHAGTMLTSMVGTPQYLAPEVVMQDKQSPGYENVVDSWSVGIIVYSMLTKALPFDEDAALPVDKRIKSRFTQAFDEGLLRQLNVSEAAIDFISRLLAKLPADRMTMAEALEHEWLAGPSSQHSESQPLALGGDSVWDILSFDEDPEPEDDLFTNDGDALSDDEGRWTRPATVSGTNMESAVGGLSDESFSQPMNNLRLTTPGLLPRSNLSPLPLSVGDSARPAEPSPPSPPLTEEPMLVDIVLPAVTTPETHRPPLLTPGGSDFGHSDMTSTGAVKRKYDAGISAFSSSSLSPPPPSSNDSQSQAKGSQEKKGSRQLLPTPPDNERISNPVDVSSIDETTPVKPRMKAAKIIAPNGESKVANGKSEANVPRSSPRRSTRPRKSMRLS
ncbi:kinase-like domain-containing protein [Kockovaella imperatae]|uniref:Kinase-like domain-containing protein n=1 Tax=Kockovaella imperatae TaxID=4999 RepID=A0A1Y1UBP8_9TREE|nr:kinase-like domain-containing protein [Kockovaella imperatae]ORX34954.1 kinase-like domain-containing protein [Kockovaella imperatae]